MTDEIMIIIKWYVLSVLCVCIQYFFNNCGQVKSSDFKCFALRFLIFFSSLFSITFPSSNFSCQPLHIPVFGFFFVVAVFKMENSSETFKRCTARRRRRRISIIDFIARYSEKSVQLHVACLYKITC